MNKKFTGWMFGYAVKKMNSDLRWEGRRTLSRQAWARLRKSLDLATIAMREFSAAYTNSLMKYKRR